MTLIFVLLNVCTKLKNLLKMSIKSWRTIAFVEFFFFPFMSLVLQVLKSGLIISALEWNMFLSLFVFRS